MGLFRNKKDQVWKVSQGPPQAWYVNELGYQLLNKEKRTKAASIIKSLSNHSFQFKSSFNQPKLLRILLKLLNSPDVEAVTTSLEVLVFLCTCSIPNSDATVTYKIFQRAVSMLSTDWDLNTTQAKIQLLVVKFLRCTAISEKAVQQLLYMQKEEAFVKLVKDYLKYQILEFQIPRADVAQQQTIGEIVGLMLNASIVSPTFSLTIWESNGIEFMILILKGMLENNVNNYDLVEYIISTIDLYFQRYQIQTNLVRNTRLMTYLNSLIAHYPLPYSCKDKLYPFMTHLMSNHLCYEEFEKAQGLVILMKQLNHILSLIQQSSEEDQQTEMEGHLQLEAEHLLTITQIILTNQDPKDLSQSFLDAAFKILMNSLQRCSNLTICLLSLQNLDLIMGQGSIRLDKEIQFENAFKVFRELLNVQLQEFSINHGNLGLLIQQMRSQIDLVSDRNGAAQGELAHDLRLSSQFKSFDTQLFLVQKELTQVMYIQIVITCCQVMFRMILLFFQFRQSGSGGGGRQLEGNDTSTRYIQDSVNPLAYVWQQALLYAVEELGQEQMPLNIHSDRDTYTSDTSGATQAAHGAQNGHISKKQKLNIDLDKVLAEDQKQDRRTTQTVNMQQGYVSKLLPASFWSLLGYRVTKFDDEDDQEHGDLDQGNSGSYQDQTNGKSRTSKQQEKMEDQATYSVAQGRTKRKGRGVAQFDDSNTMTWTQQQNDGTQGSSQRTPPNKINGSMSTRRRLSFHRASPSPLNQRSQIGMGGAIQQQKHIKMEHLKLNLAQLYTLSQGQEIRIEQIWVMVDIGMEAFALMAQQINLQKQLFLAQVHDGMKLIYDAGEKHAGILKTIQVKAKLGLQNLGVISNQEDNFLNFSRDQFESFLQQQELDPYKFTSKNVTQPDIFLGLSDQEELKDLKLSQIQMKQVQKIQEAYKIFEEIDSYQSITAQGYLDTQKLINFFQSKKLTPQKSSAICQAIFQEMDADLDGRIYFSTFCTKFTQFQLIQKKIEQHNGNQNLFQESLSKQVASQMSRGSRSLRKNAREVLQAVMTGDNL